MIQGLGHIVNSTLIKILVEVSLNIFFRPEKLYQSKKIFVEKISKTEKNLQVKKLKKIFTGRKKISKKFTGFIN